MGLYGGGSRTTIKYKEPEPDPRIGEFYKIQGDLLKQQYQDTKAEKLAASETAAAAKQAAADSVPALYDNLLSQVKAGQLTGNQAAEQLRGYVSQYQLDPQENLAGTLISTYTTEYLPSKNTSSIDAYYEQLLGRAPTPEEKEKHASRFGTVYKDVDDFKDAILNSAEYQKKFNDSQIENYWDAFYGDQLTDAEGNRTGQRTFNYSDKFMPISNEMAERAGIDFGKLGGKFTGTVGEIEEYIQGMRSTREYAFNAGLTALQGDIDKELQNIKKESASEVARITSEGQMYGGALAQLMAF
jgi:hypothetical protein